MFVEYYLPAHPNNSVAAVWQTPTIPNRPHLKDERILMRRYDILPADAVESVHLVVPDLGRANHYWAVVHSDRCLWHEKYDLAGDVQEGNYEKLNPRAFTSEGNIFSRENFTINYIEIFVEGTVFSASQRNFSQDRRVDNLSDSEEEDDEVQQEFADDISQQVERLMNQV